MVMGSRPTDTFDADLAVAVGTVTVVGAMGVDALLAGQAGVEASLTLVHICGVGG